MRSSAPQQATDLEAVDAAFRVANRTAAADSGLTAQSTRTRPVGQRLPGLAQRIETDRRDSAFMSFNS